MRGLNSVIRHCVYQYPPGFTKQWLLMGYPALRGEGRRDLVNDYYSTVRGLTSGRASCVVLLRVEGQGKGATYFKLSCEGDFLAQMRCMPTTFLQILYVTACAYRAHL